ncbi:MAG: PQQ-dependent sugar dehydrogenase [Acidobacteriota bacterium]
MQAFNGAGDTATPTWINFFCYWVLQIPLAYILAVGLELGPTGVFGSITIAQLALAIIGVVAFRRGRWNAIPEWKGSLIIGTLASEHLHRVVFKGSGVESHEVYFRDGNSLGRLREVIMGPAGQLYVTTSNCDGRGDCGPEKDKLLRITR